MGRVAEKTRLKVDELKLAYEQSERALSMEDIDARRIEQEYNLTRKQAKFVKATLEAPDAPRSVRARAAGYSEKSQFKDGGAVLKSDKIKNAVIQETRKRANIKQELQELDKNPRQYLKERFIEHAADPDIQPNQTRALELVGKMEGLFIERIEVDPGEHLRSQTASQYMTGLLAAPVDNPTISE